MCENQKNNDSIVEKQAWLTTIENPLSSHLDDGIAVEDNITL